MKRAIKFIGFLVAFVLLVISGMYFFQEKIIFLSETLPQEHQFTFEEPFEEIVLDGADGGKLHALHFKVQNPRGMVLYYHGNAGNLSKWGAVASRFTKANYDVLMMDYRGYGKSTGSRSEENFYSDAMVFYNHAKKLFPEPRILVFGRSLGTTFATFVAAKNKPRKLVLESPFFSLEHLVQERYPKLQLYRLLRYKFLTSDYIKDVRCNTTIIHGTEDGVVPIAEADKLYGLLSERSRHLVRIKNGKHNNLDLFQEYWLAIRKELAF